MKKYMVIHGHFYQPPRENPWIDSIEKQHGAEPYHDFNEKIAAECYIPNAFSKYLDGFGRILDIMNNYEFISYNFGPTLLHWISDKYPHTYRRIIEADKASVDRLGHGNAMAQVYNHVILPLATVEDIQTQIIWGIEDFRFHYGRDPEGMWLSETAISMQVVKALIDNGISFTVLSPYQADKVRELGSAKWGDVSSGTISPGHCYRIYDRDDKGRAIEDRFLDVFFYDRVLAPAISFEHLLRNGDDFLNRLEEAGKGFDFEGALVNVATDGETFGHHEPFGNMALSAVIKKLDNSELEAVNYAYVREKMPPRYEVILKKGDHGTAWSCSHGVGRWYRDCGCFTDSHAGWDQKWRTPLRDAFDYLSETTVNVYKDICTQLSVEPRKTLNRFIKYDLGQMSLSEVAGRELSPEEERTLLNALFMRKYAHYIFTSCAWFFSDISRIEPVQNMKYAIRAISFMSELDAEKASDAESSVLTILATARSNLKEAGDGRKIWKDYAMPAAVTDEHFINHYVISSAVNEEFYTSDIFSKKVIPVSEPERMEEDDKVRYKGRVRLICEKLKYEKEYVFCVTVSDKEVLSVSLPAEGEKEVPDELCSMMKKENIPPGCSVMGLKDLFYDERQIICARLLKNSSEDVYRAFENIYEENVQMLGILAECGIDIPEEFRAPAKVVLEQRFSDRFFDYLDGDLDFSELSAMREEMKRFGIGFSFRKVKKRIEKELDELIVRLSESKNTAICNETLGLIDLALELNIDIESDHYKNVVFDMLSDTVDEKRKLVAEKRLKELDFDSIYRLIELAERLNINVERFRDELNPFA